MARISFANYDKPTKNPDIQSGTRTIVIGQRVSRISVSRDKAATLEQVLTCLQVVKTNRQIVRTIMVGLVDLNQRPSVPPVLGLTSRAAHTLKVLEEARRIALGDR